MGYHWNRGIALRTTPSRRASARRGMIHVILPRAVRNMPPMLLQDASLVYAIGARDMLKAASVAGKNYNRSMEVIVLSTLIHFANRFSLSLAVKQPQKRIAIIR